MRSLVVALALLVAPALAVPGPATDLTWSNAASPGGGPVQSVGGHGSLLVASHWQGGTYRSTDSGLHWAHVDGFPAVVEARVAWDPTDALRGFVAGFGGVARTTDGGLTWEHSIVSPASYRIAMSPAGRVAVTARDDNWNTRVLASDDGGATWQDLGAPLPQFTSIYGLAFGRTDDEVVVMSISKLWYTHDDGATWTEGAGGVGLDLARTADGRLWKAAAPLQRSDDGGATWVEVDTPGESNPTVLGPGPGRLYASGAEGLLMTRDGGATWESLGFADIAFAATGLAADPADPEAVFMTHESLGVLRIAPDGQGGWRGEARTSGMPPVDIRALGASHDGALLLAAGPLGLWASRDAGLSWQHTGAGIGLAQLQAAAANTDGGVAYTGGQNAIFQNFVLVSRDGGRTFTHHAFDMGGDSSVIGLATHPTEPGTAWAAVWAQFGQDRVFETRDAGATWTEAFASEDRVHGVAWHAPTATLLVATSEGLMGRDLIEAWLPRTLGPAPAVASGGGVAYAAGDVRDVWRSVPLEAAAALLPWTDAGSVRHIAAAPDGSGAWVTASGKLQRCTGDAGTCEDVSPPGGTMQGAMLSGGRAFAATLGQGVWVAEL